MQLQGAVAIIVGALETTTAHERSTVHTSITLPVLYISTQSVDTLWELAESSSLRITTVHGQDALLHQWNEIAHLMTPTAWPKESRLREKLFFRMQKSQASNVDQKERESLLLQSFTLAQQYYSTS